MKVRVEGQPPSCHRGAEVVPQRLAQVLGGAGPDEGIELLVVLAPCCRRSVLQEEGLLLILPGRGAQRPRGTGYDHFHASPPAPAAGRIQVPDCQQHLPRRRLQALEELFRIVVVPQSRARLQEVFPGDAAVGVLVEAIPPGQVQGLEVLPQQRQEVRDQKICLRVQVRQANEALLLLVVLLEQGLEVPSVAQAPQGLAELPKAELPVGVRVQALSPGGDQGAMLSDAQVLEVLDGVDAEGRLRGAAGLGELLAPRRIRGTPGLVEETRLVALVER
mmetsp:Transcript_106410/g.254042  ORF Transcript_106410/g.254042 Transcript_106410/m.254042 type:complete len:276 (-) Transcript_106410:430-1257(-)